MALEKDTDFYTNFILQSPKIPSDNGTTTEEIKAKNATDLDDPELVEKGREFVHRNFFSVMFSHLIFMMWVLGSKFGRIVIFHTGESNDKDASLKRYLAVIVRMWDRWYDGDYTDLNSSPAFKDMETVRKIHKIKAKIHPLKPRPVLPPLTFEEQKILEAIKAEVEAIDVSGSPGYLLQEKEPEVPLSQFHMAMGQWGFMGLLVTYPKVFGLTDMKNVEGYIHLWAIFGRQLGIQDQFNWALHLKKTGGDTEQLKLIYKNVARTLLVTSDEATVLMLKAMIEGVGEYVWPVRVLPILKLMLVSMDLKGRSISRLMNFWDKLAYGFIILVLTRGGKYTVVNYLRNAYIRWCLNRGRKLYLDKSFNK